MARNESVKDRAKAAMLAAGEDPGAVDAATTEPEKGEPKPNLVPVVPTFTNVPHRSYKPIAIGYKEVVCDLPMFRGLRVLLKVNNPSYIFEDKPEGTDALQWAEWYSRFVRGFPNWADFMRYENPDGTPGDVAECPTPGQPETYVPLTVGNELSHLGSWIISTGYFEAVKASIDPNL